MLVVLHCFVLIWLLFKPVVCFLGYVVCFVECVGWFTLLVWMCLMVCLLCLVGDWPYVLLFCLVACWFLRIVDFAVGCFVVFYGFGYCCLFVSYSSVVIIWFTFLDFLVTAVCFECFMVWLLSLLRFVSFWYVGLCGYTVILI